jgi:hypothetical protein
MGVAMIPEPPMMIDDCTGKKRPRRMMDDFEDVEPHIKFRRARRHWRKEWHKLNELLFRIAETGDTIVEEEIRDAMRRAVDKAEEAWDKMEKAEIQHEFGKLRTGLSRLTL